MVIIMPKNAYRIGILGHGFIGDVHREVIEEGIKGLKVVAIAEPDAAKVARLSQKYTIFNNGAELIEKSRGKIEALIVALPTREHLKAVQDIVDYKIGIPFLLEKPLGVSYLEAEKILHLPACCTSPPAMVGLTGRFHPEFAHAYKALQRGDIGEIVSMQERIHFGLPDFPRQYVRPEHSGRGVGLENGIHTMDRLNYFSNSKVVAVEGLIKSNRHLQEPLEDYLAGIAVTESGLHIPFSLRWNEHQEEDYVFQVTGTKGTITVEGFKRCTLTTGRKQKILYQHDLKQNLRDRHKPGIKAELEHFVRYLDGKTEKNLLREALNAQFAVELLYPEGKN